MTGHDPEFWQGKKVLITGMTGFKGSWLAIWLRQLGADVLGFSLPASYCPSFFSLCKLEQSIPHLLADVRDYNQIKKTIEEFRPEIVFHLAAQALVPESYRNPLETYSTNVMGTVNVLEAIRQSCSVKAAVIVTTDKCYENKEKQDGYLESDVLGGLDPYSNSKACAELVTAAYVNSYFKKDAGSAISKVNYPHIATARAGNVIGGGDWSKERLIPDIINSLTNSTTLSIRNSEAVRPWQHVLEPLSGYLLLAQKLYLYGEEYCGAWNFGPDSSSEKSVEWIINTFLKSWGSRPVIDSIPNNPIKETKLLKLNSSKSRYRLGWKPRWDAEEALKKTAQWYKLYTLNPEGLAQLSLDQIKEYSDG